MLKNFLEKKSQENGPLTEGQDRKSNRTRQKNKRRDSKVESNDSPEIPDMGETLGIRPPWPPNKHSKVDNDDM